MSRLDGKRILIGISGGIAAYKIPDLVRRLRERGAEVRVVMTQGACQFITPLTLQAVSGQPVHMKLLDVEAESAFGHIDLARWADAILIAPATANFMAKLAHGMADDLLSTLCLATNAPLYIAPAMNQQMWAAEATQANCEILETRGVGFFGPASGSQACGEVGAGRMREPLELVANLEAQFPPLNPCLTGKRVLITAGPTREDIDPVRFISNHSSGRMGYAIAHSAYEAGAEVTLISGPTGLNPPQNIHRISVTSAQEMYAAVLACAENSDIFIATAAVADYRPAQLADQKIKKQNETLNIPLERTQDILAAVSALAQRPFCVGFAAETQNVAEYAKDKMQRKKLDMIAANQVGLPGQGFDSDNNALHLFWPGGEEVLPLASKQVLADSLIERIAERYANVGL